MASKNVDTLRAAHESWNKRDFDGVIKSLVENITYTDRARATSIKGKSNFREFVEAWARAFSDGKITNPQYTDAGNTIIAQWTVEGTNDGPFLSLPPTGRRISVAFCEIVQYDSSGRAIAGSLYYDQYSILTQLGHVKPLAAAA